MDKLSETVDKTKEKVQDTLERVQTRLRPPAPTHQPSVSSIRLAAREPAGDVETGEGSSSGGLFSRSRGVRSNASTSSPNPNRLSVPEGAQGDTSSQQSTGGGFIAGRKRALSNAVANVINFVNPPPEDPSIPVEGETQDEADERVRVANERAVYDQQVVDLLDVIDPEVSTLSTLGDLQNSLFIPNLGRFVNRTRYLELTKPDPLERDPILGSLATRPEGGVDSTAGGSGLPPPSTTPEKKKRKLRFKFGHKAKDPRGDDRPLHSIPEDSPQHPITHEEEDHRIEGRYLLLPDGLVNWETWTQEEKEELDDYVRHLLHSRKWKLRRTWRGFRQYVRTPLGAFVTIYASLLTFWGAAWVLFIIGWLPSGGRQEYFQEICDEILTALFCLVGIGLAPFRAVDTYHMIYIAHFHRKSLRLYAEQGEPPLPDENDLPDPLRRRETPGKLEKQVDVVQEEGHEREGEVVVRKPVLTVEEQATFLYHQQTFARSHTFYRPHETETHKAFPLDLLIVVVCLLDFHSIFQIALGSTTWSISYHHEYKHILTAVILSFSITCNITAGVVITVGNRRTRKTEVLEDRLRQAVTEEAVRRREHKKEKAAHEKVTNGHQDEREGEEVAIGNGV